MAHRTDSVDQEAIIRNLFDDFLGHFTVFVDLVLFADNLGGILGSENAFSPIGINAISTVEVSRAVFHDDSSEDGEDLVATIAIMRQWRAFISAAPLSELGDEELFAGLLTRVIGERTGLVRVRRGGFPARFVVVAPTGAATSVVSAGTGHEAQAEENIDEGSQLFRAS